MTSFPSKALAKPVAVASIGRATACKLDSIDTLSCIHSFGLIAIRPLATADTPQINPTGNKRGPDWLVPNKSKNTATCAAEAVAKAVISVLFDGSEKLF